MSQAGIISTTTGPVPPTVATSYVTNINSPAIPAGNVLNVFGGSVTTNNLNGIQTDGSSGGNTLTVELTNRAFGTVSTNDATPTTIITFPMAAAPIVYVLDGLVVAHDTTDNVGAGFFFTAAVRTTGAAGILISSPQFDTQFVEAPLTNTVISINVSGNNIVVIVTGIAATVIDWLAQFTYTQVV